MRTLIRGGRVVDPAQGLDRVMDLYLAGGRVAALGDAPADFVPERTIDARDRVVCPGFIDLAARLREPGQEHKATIGSEARAALAGGITTLCIAPDTIPVIDEPAVVELINRRAAAAGAARVITMGALTRGLDGKELSEMAALRSAGCAGVTNTRRPLANTQTLRRALEYAASFDLTVVIEPDDPWLSLGGCVHEGTVGTRLGLVGIPEAAETSALAQHLELIAAVGVRTHFGRLSSARSLALVSDARSQGLPVSADVSAHQLHLTANDAYGFDANCHLLPPLRTQRDLEALRAGVRSGAITAVCSDHQPHEPDAKLAPFPETAPGISALETLLPLMLRLCADGLPLMDALARLTTGPAAVLGLDRGTLAPGAVADICIFDPERSWLPGPDTLLSRGHNTPFLGWEMTGRVTHTLVAGRLRHHL